MTYSWRTFPQGKEPQVTSGPTLIRGLAWAGPRELLVSSTKGGRQETLWRIPLAGGQGTRLTAGMEASLFPAVSADGKLAFSRRADDVNLWRRPLDSNDAGNAGAVWIGDTGLDS
jgi:hypothetical protein